MSRFNKPNINLEDQIVKLTQDFYDGFAKETLGLQEDPIVFYDFDEQNEKHPLKQSTGLFNPDTNSIVIFCHGRHPKDILRSFAHELVHYSQNINGAISDEVKNRLMSGADIDDPLVQSVEGPAYRNGSFMLRKFTSSLNEGLDVVIKKARDPEPVSPPRPKEPQGPPKKFLELEQLRDSASHVAHNGGVHLSDDLVEFDHRFQDIFNPVFERSGLFLANYYEPGRFYEYVLDGEDGGLTFSIFPCGDDEYDTGRTGPVLQVTDTGEGPRKATDHNFDSLYNMFRKISSVLKQKKETWQ